MSEQPIRPQVDPGEWIRIGSETAVIHRLAVVCDFDEEPMVVYLDDRERAIAERVRWVDDRWEFIRPGPLGRYADKDIFLEPYVEILRARQTGGRKNRKARGKATAKISLKRPKPKKGAFAQARQAAAAQLAASRGPALGDNTSIKVAKSSRPKKKVAKKTAPPRKSAPAKKKPVAKAKAAVRKPVAKAKAAVRKPVAKAKKPVAKKKPAPAKKKPAPKKRR